MEDKQMKVHEVIVFFSLNYPNFWSLWWYTKMGPL